MKINFEKKKKYIHFKATEMYNEPEDFDTVKEMFKITRKNGYSRILVDVRALDYNFNTIEYYDFDVHWSEFIRDESVLISAVLVDNEKFNLFPEDVIVNRGGIFKIFTEEQEAINWLEEG